MATKVTTWKVESHSDHTKHYSVFMWDNGSITCNCPHYTNRLAGTIGTCKHIDDALDGHFLEETNHVNVNPVQRVVIKARRAALKLVLG